MFLKPVVLDLPYNAITGGQFTILQLLLTRSFLRVSCYPADCLVLERKYVVITYQPC